MQIVLFEDNKIENLYPITLMRAGFEIGCGGVNLYELVSKYFKTKQISYLVRDYLKRVVEQRYVRTRLGVGSSGHPTGSSLCSNFLFINARLVPSIKNMKEIEKIIKTSGVVLESDGTIVGAHVQGKVQGREIEEIFSKFKCKIKKTKAKVFNYPWEVIVYNQEIIEENIRYLAGETKEYKKDVYVGKKVIANENVVLDAKEGPIYIGEGTEIFPFVNVQGPVYIGENCKIKTFGDIKEGVMIGNTCKVGGEVEASIIESYSNKQHTGFLGHSYAGSWVNVGANTTNSDLKNTYGKIKVELSNMRTASRSVRYDTGLQFLGCVIGDYTKTGINTSILTGKMIGVNCNVMGMVAENIPSFTNLMPSGTTEYYLEEAIKVQKRMFDRRGVKQTAGDRRLLEEVFEMTGAERKIKKVKKGRVRV